MIRVLFHAEAERELGEAAAFYESRIPGLGKLFSAEVERIVRLLRQHPAVGARVATKRRRVLVDRFPYLVAYEHQDDFIVIVAVAHQKRRPGYWRRRR